MAIHLADECHALHAGLLIEMRCTYTLSNVHLPNLTWQRFNGLGPEGQCLQRGAMVMSLADECHALQAGLLTEMLCTYSLSKFDPMQILWAGL
jgi:hypothetical protein